MKPMGEQKVHRILSRFPWRRRKPRALDKDSPPIALQTREGEQVWADPTDLARFEDPGPALLCIAMRGDPSGRAIVRALVEHHARARGIDLPTEIRAATEVGLGLIDTLVAEAGLDPAEV